MSKPDSKDSNDLAAIIGKAGKRRHPVLRFLLFVIPAAALIAGWMWWQEKSDARDAGPSFVTVPIERGDISLVITATGNLEPTNKVTIGSELSGTTLEVYVDKNDRVTKGQPLAKIDIRRLTQQTDSSRAALVAAKAKVDQVQATLKENEAALGRLEELHRLSGGKTPAQSALVSARAAVDRAKADLGSAQAAVGQAEADLKANESDQVKAVIKSPIDGIVLTRTVEPGQTVAASFTAPELFVIAEKLEQMKLKVAVAEADIGRVEVGQKATFTVDAWPGRSYSAKVTKVSFGSAVTDNVVTYETELEVSNEDLSLRPGMTATADIHVAESKGVLLVPTAALRFDPASANSDQAEGGRGGRGSFVQNLIPFSRRRGGPGGRGGPPGERGSGRGSTGQSKIWILRGGKPEPLTVTMGLNDGRQVEVSGEGVAEGLPVITRALAPPAP